MSLVGRKRERSVVSRQPTQHDTTSTTVSPIIIETHHQKMPNNKSKGTVTKIQHTQFMMPKTRKVEGFTTTAYFLLPQKKCKKHEDAGREERRVQ
mmetsp:Transcript_144/g.203  ORF Transcript_144/g.203 Transcript_144/m.203 type:complete len:95 (+) Transcript_144:304-588(+)